MNSTIANQLSLPSQDATPSSRQLNLRTRVLEREEFYLVEPLLAPDAPPIDPEFSRIIATIDLDSEKVVGMVVLQLVLHTEPIIIDPAYRGQGIWRELGEFVDGYLTEIGTSGAYTQPLSPTTEAICEKLGYIKSNYPLWVKTYHPHHPLLIQEDQPLEAYSTAAT